MEVLARASVFFLRLIKYIPTNKNTFYRFASMYAILMLSFKMAFLFRRKFKVVV